MSDALAKVVEHVITTFQDRGTTKIDVPRPAGGVDFFFLLVIMTV